jgi:nitrile hydratase
MNGAHDSGGVMGFGPVIAEANEPVFHAPWEARVFAIAVAFGMHGGWNIDEDRSACENRPPAEYLRMSYYEIWLSTIETLMREKGITGPATHPPLAPDGVHEMLMAPASYEREAAAPARFNAGDRVRTCNMHPKGHTRLPRYLRGHVGEIVTVHGCHVFPDSNAAGQGEDPRWLYSVRFSAAEIWGHGAKDMIHADLWEPYLESA